MSVVRSGPARFRVQRSRLASLEGARRLPGWALEAMLLAGLYLAGEFTRAIARGGRLSAEADAATIVRLEWRVVGALCPVFVLFVIVATGNHFFFDAAAGAAVAGIALAATALAPRLRAGLGAGQPANGLG